MKTTKRAKAKRPAKSPTKPRKLTVRQERFCELIAGGEVPADAWIKAGHKVSRNVAKSAANRALTNVDIGTLIARLRKPQTAAATLSKEQMLTFLAQSVTTPIGEIGPDSPLCSEFIEDMIGGGARGKLRRGNQDSGNEVEAVPVLRRRVKMNDKLRALELYAKLQGYFAPDQVVVETGPKTLESIEERAKRVAAVLSIAHD